MNKGFTLVAVIALSSVFVASIADAGTMQKKKSSSRGYSGPETGLLGVKLFDSGLRVISLYGNPDSITTVGGGASSAGGGGGQGGPPGGFGGAGGSRGGGGGAAPTSADNLLPGDLIPGGGFGDVMPDMQSRGPAPLPGGGGGQGGSRSGPPGLGGGSSPAPGGPGGAGGAGGGGATESAVFTRWSYVRNGCKLGFVIDKFNRVIQIEAIGLQSQRIKTRRGVGFGSTFSTVMKSYASASSDPDGYDINGKNFTIRFLTRSRVAFRLTQLSSKKAHVVTGIVVAAGKQ